MHMEMYHPIYPTTLNKMKLLFFPQLLQAKEPLLRTPSVNLFSDVSGFLFIWSPSM